MENLDWNVEVIKHNFLENPKKYDFNFYNPEDLDVDEYNNIYIADSGDVTIKKMNFNYDEYSDPIIIAGIPRYENNEPDEYDSNDINSLSQVSNVIVDRNGAILFVDQKRGILQIESDGQLSRLYNVDDGDFIMSMIVDKDNNLVFAERKKTNYGYTDFVFLMEHDTGNIVDLMTARSELYGNHILLAKNSTNGIYYLQGANIDYIQGSDFRRAYENDDVLYITFDFEGHLLYLFRHHVEIEYPEGRYILCNFDENYGYPSGIVVDYNGDVIISTEREILKCYRPRSPKSAI